MGKGSIDVTPSFLFGLILGGLFLLVGLLFLRGCYSSVQIEKDSFVELKEKISILKDGDDSFIEYKLNDKFVIGFDKNQGEFILQLKDGSLSRPTKKPDRCGEEYACLCSCVSVGVDVTLNVGFAVGVNFGVVVSLPTLRPLISPIT